MKKITCFICHNISGFYGRQTERGSRAVATVAYEYGTRKREKAILLSKHYRNGNTPFGTEMVRCGSLQTWLGNIWAGRCWLMASWIVFQPNYLGNCNPSL